MTDMTTLVVDCLYEDLEDPEKKTTQYSWLIRTYDPDSVIRMIARLVQVGLEYQTRILYDTPMMCTQCHKWSTQTDYAIDQNDKQAKCPQCNHWVYIEECNTEEV